MTDTPARAVAAALFAACVLAGCTSGSSPTTTSTAAPTQAGTTEPTQATPTAAVSPTAVGTPAGEITPTLAPPPSPVLPAKLKAKRTKDGAEIAARYFWGVYTYANQSLDTKPLEAVSSPDCRFCKRAVKAVQRLRDGNNAVIGNAIVVHRATAPKKISGTVTVKMTISQNRGRSLRDDGTKHTLRAVPEHKATLTLTWAKNTWRVVDVKA